MTFFNSNGNGGGSAPTGNTAADIAKQKGEQEAERLKKEGKIDNNGYVIPSGYSGGGSNPWGISDTAYNEASRLADDYLKRLDNGILSLEDIQKLVDYPPNTIRDNRGGVTSEGQKYYAAQIALSKYNDNLAKNNSSDNNTTNNTTNSSNNTSSGGNNGVSVEVVDNSSEWKPASGTGVVDTSNLPRPPEEDSSTTEYIGGDSSTAAKTSGEYYVNKYTNEANKNNTSSSSSGSGGTGSSGSSSSGSSNGTYSQSYAQAMAKAQEEKRKEEERQKQREEEWKRQQYYNQSSKTSTSSSSNNNDTTTTNTEPTTEVTTEPTNDTVVGYVDEDNLADPPVEDLPTEDAKEVATNDDWRNLPPINEPEVKDAPVEDDKEDDETESSKYIYDATGDTGDRWVAQRAARNNTTDGTNNMYLIGSGDYYNKNADNTINSVNKSNRYAVDYSQTPGVMNNFWNFMNGQQGV